ncbi:MAG: SemiSWEET family transporter [Candidatus Saganbacteria bacterium]|nr:SemiSWEET family transporter [Candidatus Saganbacteria bacterium]
MIFKFIALLAAFLTSTGFVPQIIKGLKTGHLKDVSLVTLSFSSIGTFFWAIYGIYLGDWIIIVANFFTCATVVILMIMKYWYRQA